MNHTDCRRRVVDAAIDAAAVDAAARAHLQRCADCRRFADAHATALQLAPALVPAAPHDLVERLVPRLAALQAPSADLTPVRPLGSAGSRSRRRLPRMWESMTPTVAAAIVVLLVLGGLAVVSDTATPSPEEVLLTAAQQTAAEGSAEVALEAEAGVVVAVPDRAGAADVPPPDLTAVPPQLHAELEARWSAAMAEFERAMQEFEAQLDAYQREVDALLDEQMRQLDEQLGEIDESFGGPGRAPSSPQRPQPPEPPEGPGRLAPPQPPSRPAPQPPRPPSRISAGFDVSAHGTIGFDGRRLHVEGTADGAPFSLRVEGDTARYRRPDGTWVELPGPAGPLGSVLLDPGALERILGAPQGEVRAEGTVELDGERVRRYRFRVRDDAFAGTVAEGLDGEVSADAWVDAEGRVRRLALDGEGLVDARSGVRWRAAMALQLGGFGSASPTADLPEAAAAVPPPDRPAQVVYPFGAAVGGGQ